MQEEIDFLMEEARESMTNSVNNMQKELIKIRTGKASPAIFSSLLVNYYGSMTPLTQVANVSTADARTLTIQPWEKSMLGPIEQAIFAANLGFTPQNDGIIIRINMPPLTEERRVLLVKQAKGIGEDTKVRLRNARRDAIQEIKKAVKDGYSEDLGKRYEDRVQAMTNEFGKKIDTLLTLKEKDIMTV